MTGLPKSTSHIYRKKPRSDRGACSRSNEGGAILVDRVDVGRFGDASLSRTHRPRGRCRGTSYRVVQPRIEAV